MAVTYSAMRTEVREWLRDLTTRRDGTAISEPYWADAELTSGIDRAVRGRLGLLGQYDKTFYVSTNTYTGITDAVALSDNEVYNFPTSPTLKTWIALRRSDLDTKPLVELISAEDQEPVSFQMAGLFDALFAQYPENLTPSGETVSLSAATFRIKPAPASTSYTYKLWFVRNPVTGGSNVDIPDDWQTIIALDTAIDLGSAVGRDMTKLMQNRDLKLADKFSDFHGRVAGPARFGPVRY